MNALTQDIISAIVTRNYSTIRYEFKRSLLRISYTDKNGKYHKTNGPAILWGSKNWDWRVHGKLHRDQAPAVKTLFNYVWYNMGKFVAQRRR